MATFNNFIHLLQEAEGGYINHVNDPGGATNKGWTLANFVQYGFDNDQDGDIDLEDLKLMTDAQAQSLYKTHFWDKMRADEINSQKVANTYVDHGVNTGRWRAVMMIQFVLLTQFGKLLVLDGIIGSNTLNAINSVPGDVLAGEFNLLRKDYYNFRAGKTHLVRNTQIKDFIDHDLKVAPNSSQQVFINGWLNRVAMFQKAVRNNVGTYLAFAGLAVFMYMILKQ